MSTNILMYAAVTCLTFSSMVQMSVIPQTTIIDEMREDLSNCSFPPMEVLKENSQSGVVSLCAVTKPFLKEDKTSNYDLAFSFGKYLCMELYDLSLQLCSKNVSVEKFLMSEDDFVKISSNQNVTTFCERLQFSSSRAKKTSQWADIAVDTLKDRTLCESHCIKQNYLNPVCGAISWANALLISRSQKQPTLEKPDSQVDVPLVHPKQEQETSEIKEEAPNPSIPKDEINPKVFNSSSAENRVTSSKVNEIARFNGDASKDMEINTGGQTSDKNLHVISSTQLATATSTVASIIADVANREMGKDDDHEEELGVHSSRMAFGDTFGNEDNRLPSGNELGNVGPKGSNAYISQEGVADEDVQSRGDSASGLPIESRGYHDTFVDAQDSHFFAYFLTMVVICIVGYLVFHNKQKIIALALEGRRMQGSRRRPNTSSYKKLDSNLEEAVTSNCSSSSMTHVLF